MSTPEDVHATALRMIKRYGASLAQEFAYGYAVGVYFQQTRLGRQHWFKVWDEIEKLAKGTTDT